MEKTARDHLVDALEDLEEEQLKKFKGKLPDAPLRPGFAPIPRGKLQKADALDLSDLLLSYYAEPYALHVAVQVLQAIGLRRQAGHLQALIIGENDLVQAPVPSSCGASGRYGPQELVTAELHFVDKHRAALIERTSTVEAVLDQLHGSILGDEQYEIIVSQKTNPEKMRELYKLMKSWNRSCKDRLYEALKAKNKFLIQDLEGR